MSDDPVMKEMRRIKEARAARYGYDIHAMAEAMRERQRSGGQTVVSLRNNMEHSAHPEKQGPPTKR